MEEILRIEKSRERLRKMEEERIKAIEAAEKLKQEKSLLRIVRKQKEEEERQKLEEEKARVKEERKRRMGNQLPYGNWKRKCWKSRKEIAQLPVLLERRKKHR